MPQYDSCFFRTRTIGRAASPPTWACYEQIPYPYDDNEEDDDDDDDDSLEDSASCSEDEKGDYHCSGNSTPHSPVSKHIPVHSAAISSSVHDKGKGRAIDPDGPVKELVSEHKRGQHRKQSRQNIYNLRPILTIQRSQGFVWNQDLFVPPYIKDRYVASTSPPNSQGFGCGGLQPHSALTDYEVDVVEIRVQDSDLQDIIP